MREISLWLHNKLGGSDTWVSGSIAGQFNKDILGQIKEIFPDLQTQVKLKLLLSFFHIPRRYIDEVNIFKKPKFYPFDNIQYFFS